MNTIGQLDSVYVNLINNIMTIESQPLTRLQEQRDSIEVQRGAYASIQSRLDELQKIVQSLISNDPFSVMNLDRSTSIVSSDPDAAVLTASAASSAIAGQYSIENITLATAHRVRSEQQTYADQSLGLSGTFLIGGAETRAQSTLATVANTITSFDTAELAEDQVELGSGAYFVEVRNDAEAGWQFRLVDSEGQAVSIQDADDATKYTSLWQEIPAGGGSYDTGRGLTLTFGSDSGQYQAASRTLGNAAQVDYTAQGASISVSTSDTLNQIASAINQATYAQGNEVAATIVDRQLVLSAVNTGDGKLIVASDLVGTVLSGSGVNGLGILGNSDGDGDGFEDTLQSPINASFKVNGVTVSRSRNTGISDVITGVTLDLKSDAPGNSATLDIRVDSSTIQSTAESFVEKFNGLLTYIEEQTSISKLDDGTYKRGKLANETVFGNLRGELFSFFMSNFSNTGKYDNLRDIGLLLSDSLRVSIDDPDLFATALENDFSDVTSLLDEAMSTLDSMLERFTGSGGYLDRAVDSLDSQIVDVSDSIDSFNERLLGRQAYLIQQYSEIQAQLEGLSYLQQWTTSLYG